jgi:hypothetical protein
VRVCTCVCVCAQMAELVRTLQPGKDFYPRRDALRRRLEDIIVTQRGVPQASRERQCHVKRVFTAKV